MTHAIAQGDEREPAQARELRGDVAQGPDRLVHAVDGREGEPEAEERSAELVREHGEAVKRVVDFDL